MLLRSFLIGLIIFSMAIASSAIFIGDLNSAYGTNMNTSFNGTYNKINDISADANTMVNKVDGSTGIETAGAELFFTGTWSTIKLIFNSFDLVAGDDGMIETTSKEFLPDNRFSWFAPALVAMISITIVFVILSSLMRRPL